MRFTVNEVEYDFVETPTFGEARAIEKITGRAFASLAEGGQSIDLIQALLWISMRRVDPEIAFNDLDDIDLGLMAQLEAQREPEVPTVGDVDSNTETTSPLSA